MDIKVKTRDLSSQHDVGSPLDSVDKGLPAAVEVVELRLGDGVVDVDGGDLQGVVLEHLVQVVHTSGRLLRQALDSLRHGRVKGEAVALSKDAHHSP